MIYSYVLICILSLIGGSLILWKAPRVTRSDQSTQPNSLSIIIPARNEESNLPTLLKSLTKQSLQPLEIIVVDDHSEDQTVTVAEQYGAKVVQLKEMKVDWVGKSAGCWAGANASKGDRLLFLDADCFLPHKTSLAKINQSFDAQKEKGILSIQPYHEIKRAYENLSVLFNIMVLAGMNRFSILGKKLEPAGAFGPSLLCSRDFYFGIGGHESVKESLMENIDLGKLVLEKDRPVSLLSGKDSLHFRMYPDGIRSLIQGWSKSFATASGSTHPVILIGTSLWMAGAFITFFALLYTLIQGSAVGIILTVIGYLLFYLLFLRMARLAGNFSPLVLFVYPVIFIFFVSIFIWSFIKTFLFKTVDWKGRKVEV